MKLLIVGAGGHGRCCLDIALESYDEVAFLDDHAITETVNDCRIIGSIDEMSSFYLEYTKIFIAIGNNEVREKLVRQAQKIGYEVIRLISKKASISKYAEIDVGTVVFPNSVIEASASIGKGCIITANTTINHDATVEAYCLVYSNTVIRPNSWIEKLSRIGSGCVVCSGVHVSSNTDIKDGSIIREDT